MAPNGSHKPVVVQGLRAGYGERLVLDGVDFTAEAGRITVVLGGSGCGKSTLLRACVGLLRPRHGSVEILGTHIHDADEPERNVLMGRVGLLFQHGALLNGLTVAENVALPLRERFSISEAVLRELVEIKLALVGLPHAAHLLPRELSGGMAKRVALARAMVLDPEILFCDEPSAGLDPVTAAGIDDLLIDLRDRFQTTIVVVTHELASIRTIADNVMMLAEGRVLAAGSLEAVEASEQPAVRAFFERQHHTTKHGLRSILEVARESSQGD